MLFVVYLRIWEEIPLVEEIATEMGIEVENSYNRANNQETVSLEQPIGDDDEKSTRGVIADDKILR